MRLECSQIVEFNPSVLHEVEVCEFTFLVLLLVFAKVRNWVLLHVQVDDGSVHDKVLRMTGGAFFDRYMMILINDIFSIEDKKLLSSNDSYEKLLDKLTLRQNVH